MFSDVTKYNIGGIYGLLTNPYSETSIDAMTDAARIVYEKIGRLLSSYIVEEICGEGAYAIILKVRQNDQVYAAKIQAVWDNWGENYLGIPYPGASPVLLRCELGEFDLEIANLTDPGLETLVPVLKEVLSY